MNNVSESTASKDLGSLVEEVWESRVPVAIHRDNGHSAVVISIDDFGGMAASKREELDETESLLSNPENARRLLAAVEDVKNGRNLRERHLIDE